MRTPDDQFSFLRSNENWNGNRASSRTFSLTRTNEEARSLLRGHAPHVCCIKRSGNLLLRDVTYVRATCAKYHLDPIPSTLNFSFSLLFFFCSFFFFFVRFAKEVCARARHRCIRLRVMGDLFWAMVMNGKFDLRTLRLMVINLSVIENTKGNWLAGNAEFMNIFNYAMLDLWRVRVVLTVPLFAPASLR